MNINLKKSKKMQTLYGWGTSACWWSQYCSDEETQNKISDLLYGDDGLRLNIYRYNVGGGTDESNCRLSNPWRKTESFMLFDRESEETSWDFSRDKNAVNMMKKCLDTGNIDTLILFCNSPHYSHTSTGQASGSLLYSTCNLPKMNYRKFADYLLTVAQHFIDEGLPVKYISPINEPQWKWGGTHVWQEGCHYEIEELTEIYHIFADEILKRKMDVKLYGPESGNMLGLTSAYLNALISDPLIMQVMDIFAYHSYHSDDKPENRYEFKKELADKHPELRFDMSEWCELPNKSHTKDFKGALITARVIGQDLVYGAAESWTSWVAVNQFAVDEKGNDYSDALITANNDFTQWYIAKRYYGFAHFSKYIPVGSKVLDIGLRPTADNNDLNAFAFETPKGETVLVAVNEKEDTTLEIDGDYNEMKIIMSNQDNELSEIYNGKFKTEIESSKNSILTIIFD
ncbi:MAG: glycoside hydrolase [Eubacterium sp.]